MGNYSSQESKGYKSIQRSTSLYGAIMEGAKLDMECERQSSDVVDTDWSSDELAEYIKKMGY